MGGKGGKGWGGGGGGGILNPPKCLNYAYLSLLIISCGIVRNTKQNHRLLLHCKLASEHYFIACNKKNCDKQ